MPGQASYLVTFTNPIDNQIHKQVLVDATTKSEAIAAACSRWDIVDHILARQYIEARRAET